MGTWNTVSLVQAWEEHLSGSLVVEILGRRGGVSHVPENILSFGSTTVAIAPCDLGEVILSSMLVMVLLLVMHLLLVLLVVVLRLVDTQVVEAIWVGGRSSILVVLARDPDLSC